MDVKAISGNPIHPLSQTPLSVAAAARGATAPVAKEIQIFLLFARFLQFSTLLQSS
jgi:hypothetical protein